MFRAGLWSIKFQNWNRSSIPMPELELVELKILELELKTGTDFFATVTAVLNN